MKSVERRKVQSKSQHLRVRFRLLNRLDGSTAGGGGGGGCGGGGGGTYEGEDVMDGVRRFTSCEIMTVFID